MAEPADLDGRHREPPVRKGADGSSFSPFIQGAPAARKERNDAFLFPPPPCYKKSERRIATREAGWENGNPRKEPLWSGWWCPTGSTSRGELSTSSPSIFSFRGR